MDADEISAYCRILDLGRQLNQAVGDKDEKKLKALARQVIGAARIRRAE